MNRPMLVLTAAALAVSCTHDQRIVAADVLTAADAACVAAALLEPDSQLDLECSYLEKLSPMVQDLLRARRLARARRVQMAAKLDAGAPVVPDAGPDAK